MFIHRGDEPTGGYLITQASHAWMAWQVAEHWGSRTFLRPAPRAETLAAIFLHDAGWAEFDAAPSLDNDGRLRTFDRMVASDHVQIWRACVARVAANSRYAALIVASHFAAMAEKKTADLVAREDAEGARSAQSFMAEMARLQRSWREALHADPRYETYVDGPGWQNNAALLAACDRISVFLCAGLGSPFAAEAMTRADGPVEVEFSETDKGHWRVRPWPLQGNSIRIHCEGSKLATTRFDSVDELHWAMAQAPVVRLSFTLARPSAS